jgi:glycosyltransferase involved in cell wall biosynthesis
MQMSFSVNAPVIEKVELKLSVVVATYNRTERLSALLQCLTEQSLPPDRFELILVDDGSTQPARQVLDAHPTRFVTRLVEQQNTGQAIARDKGVREALGEVVVVLDDDMQLKSDLLERHLAWHQKGYRVVLGRIASASQIENMPLFERFHAAQLDRNAAGFRNGNPPRGIHLCTGNVSFRRVDYLAIGGFDSSLKRSEDRELGIRLELNGASFVFGDDAVTIHDSDHANLDVWLGRAYNYGIYDHRIFEKHPDEYTANPWRFLFQISPVSRPFMVLVTMFPNAGKHLATYAWKASDLCDHLGFKRVAVKGVTYVYGVEYFRGLRHQAGSMSRCFGGVVTCIRQSSKLRHGKVTGPQKSHG